jgi:hypothetical protein
MIRLTREQKLEVYTFMYLCCLSNLEAVITYESKAGIPNGFCTMFDEWLYEGRLMSCDYFFYNSLPELDAQRPVKYGMYWFSVSSPEGYEQRLACLDNAIQLTEKLNDHEEPNT